MPRYCAHSNQLVLLDQGIEGNGCLRSRDCITPSLARTLRRPRWETRPRTFATGRSGSTADLRANRLSGNGSGGLLRNHAMQRTVLQISRLRAAHDS
jgi:hypothetical protein